MEGDFTRARHKQDLPLHRRGTVAHRDPTQWFVSPASLLGYHIPEHTVYYGSLLCWQSLAVRVWGVEMTQYPRWLKILWLMEDEPGMRGQFWETVQHHSTFDTMASNTSLERNTTPLCFCARVHVTVTLDVKMCCASKETERISCDSLRQCVQLPGSAQHVPAHRAAASRQRPGSEMPPMLSTSKEDCVPAGDNLKG